LLRTLLPFCALLFAPACGGPSITNYDARAPDVPFISQYNPAGKDATYDGSEFCGPAVLAGVARAHHLGAGMSDAALIEEIAIVAGTQGDGTTGHGMLAGLAWLGMQSDANAGSDLDWVDSELTQGHDVIANGDFYAVPGRENPNLHSGHYMAITGVGNGWSMYKVTDPASSDVAYLTDVELDKFISSNPQGGFTLSGW
jgi:hypothetical protein